MTFAVVGESLIDRVMPLDGEMRDTPGGSAMNVAVGLARLGVDTVFLTSLGDDPYGAQIRRHLSESGVRLADGSVALGGRTSVATAHLDTDGAATYDFDISWELGPKQLPSGTTGLHYGSLGTVLEPGRDTVAALADEAVSRHLFVSFDPNIRPMFLGERDEEWERFRGWAAHATLVKMSDEDLEALAPDADPVDVAKLLLDNGVTELVVITGGDEGARAFTRHHSARTLPAPTALVDTVGAGDSFMSALIAIALEWGTDQLTALSSTDLETMLVAAATAAGITCGRRGADPPRRADLPSSWPRLTDGTDGRGTP